MGRTSMQSDRSGARSRSARRSGRHRRLDGAPWVAVLVASAFLGSLALSACGSGSGAPRGPTDSHSEQPSATAGHHRSVSIQPGSPIGTPSPLAPSGTLRPGQRRAALALIREYASAFSTRNIGELAALLSPSVRIDGAGPHACLNAAGSSASLTSFRTLFALRVEALKLRGLTHARLVFTRDAASISLDYLLSRSSVEPIHFWLTKTGSGWQIDRMTAVCAESSSSPLPPTVVSPPRTGKAAARGQNVVHPAPGCTVVLTPTRGSVKTRSGSARTPTTSALRSLCNKGKRSRP